MSACLLIALLASAPPVAQPGRNPALSRAEVHLESLRYGEALAALDEALEVPDNRRADLLRTLALRGVTAASLDLAEEATAAFRMLLSLDPGHTLDREYAPRIRAAFAEGQRWVEQNGALGFAPYADRPDGRARVRVAGDALGLARGVRFHFFGAEGRIFTATSGVADGTAELELPAGAEGGWWAELVGAREAVLAHAGTADAPLPLPAARVLVVAPASPAPPLSPPVAPPRYRPVAWGLLGGAGAALTSGMVYGVRSQSARARIAQATTDADGRVVGLSQVQARALEARSQREAVTANVLLGAAAGLALAGAGVWWWGGRVAVTPTPSGLAVGGALP